MVCKVLFFEYRESEKLFFQKNNLINFDINIAALLSKLFNLVSSNRLLKNNFSDFFKIHFLALNGDHTIKQKHPLPP